MLGCIRQCVLLVYLASSYRICTTLSCNKIDQCKCKMSDGSGIINLRSVGNPGDGSQDPAFGVPGIVSHYYRYNPCYSWNSTQFTDLAVLQETLDGSIEYNLGTQSSERFTYSPASGVSIKYEDHRIPVVRNSSVILVCNSAATEHLFEFLGELISTEYELLLSGPCACPGGCDDNGVIVQTTQKITTTTLSTTTLAPDITASVDFDSTFNWDHMGNMLVGLIFHDFILIFVIVLVLIILRFAFGYDCSSKQPHKSMNFSEA